MKQRSCRVVILISGRGSNMQAIVREAAHLPALDIAAIIANLPDAEGLRWAQKQALPTCVVSHRDHATRMSFDSALGDAIARYEPDYILLAGFMRILTAPFVARFAGKVINIHPSLLPAFPGLHTHRQALDMGVQWHGCTVHFVTPTVDHGPIIAQGVVPVRTDDTESTLAQRVLQVEHVVYPQVVRWLVEQRVHLDARRQVVVDGVDSRSFRLNTAGNVCLQGRYG